MEERSGYFAVPSQGLGHPTRSVALAPGLMGLRADLYFHFLAA